MMMSRSIFVINPNSSEAVTQAIDRALDCLRTPGELEIRCLTLEEGPPGIESQRQSDGVIRPLCNLIGRLEEQAAAFVIACFSDPGLHSAREETTRPVLGIAESGALTALTMGQRFGVISILAGSIPRHMRYFGAMGILDRLAGDRAVGLGVAELADHDKTFARMVEVAKSLRDGDGANVLVLGCAGMADYRTPLAKELKMPVVDPTQSAVAMAIGRVRLSW
jgi:allantoin racemase